MTSAIDSIQLLEELLRYETINPPGNEAACVDFISEVLTVAGFQCEILASPAGRANLIATWPHADPDAVEPPLVLLSHIDVVEVDRKQWSVDPFAGVRHGGKLYGRGALDMKGIAAAHIAAAVAIARTTEDAKRRLIIAVVSDEEAGSAEGVKWLLDHHPEKLGFGQDQPPEVLCEGGFGLVTSKLDPIVPIVLAEKQALWITAVAEGRPGHGSLPPARNAAQVIAEFASYMTMPRLCAIPELVKSEFRQAAKRSSGLLRTALLALASPIGPILAFLFRRPLAKHPVLSGSVRDTITLTMLSGGAKENVVPAVASCSFDCRLLPSTDVSRFMRRVTRRAKRAGIELTVQRNGHGTVSQRGPLYDSMVRATADLPGGPAAIPAMTTAFTDLRLMRERGAYGYGWMPLVLTEQQWSTIHGHDEHVDIEPFRHAVRAIEAVLNAALYGSPGGEHPEKT